MASTASLLLLALGFLVVGSDAFRKYDYLSDSRVNSNEGSGSGESGERRPTSPLASRIRKLPPRYSQHVFSPFQPVHTEDRTYIHFPRNPAAFFGPQSYWGQVANRMIDNVVGTVGGRYAHARLQGVPAVRVADMSDSEKQMQLESFRRALKLENVTRLQFRPMFEKKRVQGDGGSGEVTAVALPAKVVPTKPSGSHSREHIPSSASRERLAVSHERPSAPANLRDGSAESVNEVRLDARYPTLWRDRQRVAMTRLDNEAFVGRNAEIVRPTPPTPPTLSPVREVPTTTTTTVPIEAVPEYGILPNLLLKNPNARSQFYHLERFANPQIPVTITASKRGRFGAGVASGEKVVWPERGREIRRKPARLGPDSTELSPATIKFRSALKQILADYRRTNQLPSALTARQQARLAGYSSERRRHPTHHRRVVILPARYEAEESFRRW